MKNTKKKVRETRVDGGRQEVKQILVRVKALRRMKCGNGTAVEVSQSF